MNSLTFQFQLCTTLEKEKVKARMIWKNMNETCPDLFSSNTEKKLKLDFATVVDDYNDSDIIL